MNPYENLPPQAFWRPAVSAVSLFSISGLWDPKFQINRKSKIATFGSCFAQHFGRELRDRKFNWMNTESAPFGLSPENQKLYNYDVFSCRTTNIYTTSLLRHWVELSLKLHSPSTEIWHDNSRFRDPLRPTVEPTGFSSEAELLASRAQAVSSFEQIIRTSDVFVFTLGLTESWVNAETGYEYQMCPGTAGGAFDETVHKFVNQDFTTVSRNLRFVISKMRSVNPKLKFLLTVSPVPLTATMSGNHVLVATMASKSILRAVCAQLSSEIALVDYFPSYEIINSPAFKGVFFEPNMRNVHKSGVDFVMKAFFNALASKFKVPADAPKQLAPAQRNEEEVVCEEELLAAFGNSSGAT